jgi:DNA-3-methyladenine glycosylase II
MLQSEKKDSLKESSKPQKERKKRIIIERPPMPQEGTPKQSPRKSPPHIHHSFEDTVHKGEDPSRNSDYDEKDLYNSSSSEESTPREVPGSVSDTKPVRKHLPSLGPPPENKVSQVKSLTLDFDLEGIKKILVRKDPKLREVFLKVKLDFKDIIKPPYVALVGAVIGQRIGYAEDARKIRGRLFAAMGTNFTREDIERLTDTDLIKFGISGAKVDIIRAANKFLESKKLETEEDIKRLAEVKGIKGWTVANILLVTMANLDIFPPNDVWMMREIPRIYGNTPIERVIEKWSSYKSIAAWHLWRLPKKGKSKGT